MRFKLSTLIVLIIGLVTHFCFVQTSQAQEKEFPFSNLTTEEKLSRSAWVTGLMMIDGISYAKSVGQSCEHYSIHMIKLFASTWKWAEGNPVKFISGNYTNWSLDKDFKMEISDFSDKIVKGRMTFFKANTFSEKSEYLGVTVKEYEKFFEIWHTELAKYLGLEYKQQKDGEWINFTVTQK